MPCLWHNVRCQVMYISCHTLSFHVHFMESIFRSWPFHVIHCQVMSNSCHPLSGHVHFTSSIFRSCSFHVIYCQFMSISCHPSLGHVHCISSIVRSCPFHVIHCRIMSISGHPLSGHVIIVGRCHFNFVDNLMAGGRFAWLKIEGLPLWLLRGLRDKEIFIVIFLCGRSDANPISSCLFSRMTYHCFSMY